MTAPLTPVFLYDDPPEEPLGCTIKWQNRIPQLRAFTWEQDDDIAAGLTMVEDRFLGVMPMGLEVVAFMWFVPAPPAVLGCRVVHSGPIERSHLDSATDEDHHDHDDDQDDEDGFEVHAVDLPTEQAPTTGAVDVG